MIDHVLQTSFAQRKQLSHDADIVLGHIDREPLDRFTDPAVDLARDDLRLPYGQLESLPAHDFDEHRELQLAAALHLPCVGSLGVAKADRDVADQFLVEPRPYLSGSELCALLTRQGRGVDTDDH